MFHGNFLKNRSVALSVKAAPLLGYRLLIGGNKHKQYVDNFSFATIDTMDTQKHVDIKKGRMCVNTPTPFLKLSCIF